MRKLLFGLVLSMLATSAMATSWLVEPYLGYSLISGNRGIKDIKGTGMQFGGRVGVNIAIFSAGLLYDKTRTDSIKFEGANSKGAATINNGGLFVLAALPLVGLRAWGSYFLISRVVGRKAGGEIVTDGSKYGGDGLGIGLGLKLPIIPLAFNVEYRRFSYDKKDWANGDPAHMSLVSVTLSAPLTF